ncbi:MAG TPA: energy transducer TonB [Candidatus Udaeobacter sp.]|jgi:TonB family protein|nr:energy transducer TonB [Candidatus Udaeobacter sp.]
MKPTALVTLGITIASAIPGAATAQLVIVSSKPRATAIYAPPPQYPRAARMANVTGGGTAILDIDPQTGLVKAAQMNPSTGDKDLDHAALAAFRQWRFRPGETSSVNVPIRFTKDTGLPTTSRSSTKVRQYALYAPPPVYPAEARSKHLTGLGVGLIEVDLRTGSVTAARMLQSTGYRVLDDAALNAFRQWRFEPGTVSRIRIPIRFLMHGIVPVVYE